MEKLHTEIEPTKTNKIHHKNQQKFINLLGRITFGFMGNEYCEETIRTEKVPLEQMGFFCDILYGRIARFKQLILVYERKKEEK